MSLTVAGNDVLTDGYGNNIYLFNRGDGRDTATDYSGGVSSTDKVMFGAGIAQADLAFARSGSDLIIAVAEH